MGRSYLYNLLANILYTGQLRVDKALYPGEHEAIIDQETFDLVQAPIKENSVCVEQRGRTRMESLPCEVRDYADFARLGYMTRARITEIMNLLDLATDIQEAIPLQQGTQTI